jgi:hypothetical protein
MNSIKFKALWIGGELSLFEKACLLSFVRLGQSIELFTYETIKAPKGVIIRDASEIVSKDKVRKNAYQDSYATFSNLFRYELLYKEGGCWVDTDVMLLKVPDWPNTVLAYEDDRFVNGAVLSLPRNVCEWLISEFHKIGYDIAWGEVGPRLVTRAVEEFKLSPLPKERIYPIHWESWRSFLQDIPEEKLKDADCVHLWNEMFRRDGINKNQMPSGWLGKKFKDIFEQTAVKESANASGV